MAPYDIFSWLFFSFLDFLDLIDRLDKEITFMNDKNRSIYVHLLYVSQLISQWG